MKEKNTQRESIFIMTDGYYRRTVNELSYYLFLYTNGSVLFIGGFKNDADMERWLKKMTPNKIRKFYGFENGWGRFLVNKEKITVQIASQLNSGGIPRHIGILEFTGIITSSTSFEITSTRNSLDKEEREINGHLNKYVFVPSVLKPDSSNWVNGKFR